MDRPRMQEEEEPPADTRRLGSLPHDRRIVLLALATGLPGILVSLGFLWLTPVSAGLRGSLTVLLVITWLGASLALRERVVRPLQTLANMLAALREGDFSIRARIPDQGSDDALGREREVDLDAQAFAVEVVQHVQKPERPPVGQAIGHEVH